MNNPEITIPENIQEICRDLAKVAQKHNLHSFEASFRPSFEMQWGGTVSLQWAEGRHGEDRNQLKIASSFNVFTRVTTKIPPQS